MLGLLHFESHGHGFEAGHTLCYLLGSQAQVEAYGEAVERVLYGGVVCEGYGVAPLEAQVAVVDGGACLLLLHRRDEEGLVGIAARPGYLAGRL